MLLPCTQFNQSKRERGEVTRRKTKAIPFHTTGTIPVSGSRITTSKPALPFPKNAERCWCGTPQPTMFFQTVEEKKRKPILISHNLPLSSFHNTHQSSSVKPVTATATNEKTSLARTSDKIKAAASRKKTTRRRSIQNKKWLLPPVVNLAEARSPNSPRSCRHSTTRSQRHHRPRPWLHHPPVRC
jgi:hypothetical protein